MCILAVHGHLFAVEDTLLCHEMWYREFSHCHRATVRSGWLDHIRIGAFKNKDIQPERPLCRVGKKTVMAEQGIPQWDAIIEFQWQCSRLNETLPYYTAGSYTPPPCFCKQQSVMHAP